MSKAFAPRLSKRDRKTIDLSSQLNRPDLFRQSDDKLLQGAKIGEIKLADIVVEKQVRTKFNDDSLRELAENIKANGLIQPLVVHREGSKYTLICGERRFRAMSLIQMEKAPCFILENKTHEELMAIQFSENSSREELHYIDKADGIYNYQKATKASERKIQAALGISKSEVHRSLLIAKLDPEIKEAAKRYNIEKYVLVEWEVITDPKLKSAIRQQILSGEVSKRTQLKKQTSKTVKISGQKIIKNDELPSRDVLMQVFKKASSGKKLDRKTLEIIENFVASEQ